MIADSDIAGKRERKRAMWALIQEGFGYGSYYLTV
jgi:hypothetical protein